MDDIVLKFFEAARNINWSSWWLGYVMGAVATAAYAGWCYS